jgi:hypothetical protein
MQIELKPGQPPIFTRGMALAAVGAAIRSRT